MGHMDLIAKRIEQVDSGRFCCMAKLTGVVRLDRFRRIPEENNRSFEKIYRGIAALLPVRIDEPLAARFFDHGVLVEFSPSVPT